MTFEELKDKALSLPYEPGVYIMQDKTGTVIYVGKAKKLKNRVSQYFQDTAAHTPKTRKMVSQIDHFDTIVARSEFEALVLECSLIKRHMPKYNILLKDDKGYPYLRVDLTQDYPVMQMVSKTAGDKASYFGPFGGRSVTQHVIDTLRLTLKLPGCSKQFPRDLGKDRPCLNFHMNNCDGWCQLSRSQQDYHARMEQAVLILQGNYKKVADELRTQMEAAADKLQFELAASLRDRLTAAGIRVSMDDSDQSAGWKFAQYEMKGVPLRVEIGPKDMEKGQCCIARRDTGEKTFVPLTELESAVQKLLQDVHDNLYAMAAKNLEDNTFDFTTWEEVKEMAQGKGGFARTKWCGSLECELAMKEKAGVSSRCMPLKQSGTTGKCVVCGKECTTDIYWGVAY